MILGMVGWRGMVGSVLTNRMREENDFAFADKVIFYSTEPGRRGPCASEWGAGAARRE